MLRNLDELDAWCSAHGVVRVAYLIGALDEGAERPKREGDG
jgi:hypothetical protein